jgi:hypothetical protein
MTEAGWRACYDARPTLEFLHGRASDRKLRLFACACCRAAPDLLDDAEVREAIETSERYADGLATREQLQAARRGAASALARCVCYLQPWHAVWRVAGALLNVAAEPLLSSLNAADWFDGYFQAMQQASGRHCPLFRDIFGNPFASATFDPAWRSPTVSKLGQAIYEDLAFDRLPVLADALEEAGCDQADILAHLRGGGEHARGCWVIVLVLARG